MSSGVQLKNTTENVHEVSAADLPLHCPTSEMALWNSHPKVYLPIEKTGSAKCPYCGAEYHLIRNGG
ncbi:MAG TPA: zinc-finger domain-containing protein [Gammaproteobacteria bacterium]|nr:zinc-finger domain-containing protein [Gammaproteobacteria bacterium]